MIYALLGTLIVFQFMGLIGSAIRIMEVEKELREILLKLAILEKDYNDLIEP